MIESYFVYVTNNLLINGNISKIKIEIVTPLVPIHLAFTMQCCLTPGTGKIKSD